MNDLNINEKRHLISDLCKKHLITAYEIGENTTVSNVAAHNILTGLTANPREKTLNIILKYIENKIVGTNIDLENNVVNEPDAEYYKKDEKILSAIDKLYILLTKDLNIISEGVAKTYLNTNKLLLSSNNIEKETKNLRSSIIKLETLISK